MALVVALTALPAFADNVSQIIGDGNVVVFVDVPQNHWARNDIEYFASRGIVSGNGDGTFSPDGGVTREQFCKMLVLAFNAALETPNSPSFSDVDENSWSYAYVEVCKDFMTGYANPFGGLPAFHPTEYATREDIAVALVRMMGLTEKDANNPNYAARAFDDGGSISPALLPYVSLACERGLINGYPDGTFGPYRGITRAEAVSLLNRATKSAVSTINSELELSASVSYSKDGKTATIHIETEEGASVAVNGESVSVSNNGYGKYEGAYVYTFDDEGKMDFEVRATKQGKSKTVEVTAKYEISAPVLTITQCPTNVSTKEITISGKATDEKYDVSLTIDGESVYVSSSGSWSQSYILNEGENKFVFVATNTAGKTVTEERTVTFSVGGPKLTITQCPTNVTTKEITISGKVSDDNYGVSLTINEESVWINVNKVDKKERKKY